MYFESRPQNYWKYKSLISKVIVLEGTIGVGKTTLGKQLEDYLTSIGHRVKFFPEPKIDSMLKSYINNMKKYAFSFQFAMLLKRIELYREAKRLSEQGYIVIIDRSLDGDYIFASMQYKKGFIDDEDWNIYTQYMKDEQLLEPDLTLFLDCSTDTSVQRLKLRGRDEEIDGYDYVYLDTLNQEYKKLYQRKNKSRCFIIDWNDIPSFDYVLDICK